MTFMLFIAAIAILIAFVWGAIALWMAEKDASAEYERVCAQEKDYVISQYRDRP